MPAKSIRNTKRFVATLALAACAVIAGLHPEEAGAQAYPSKPVHLVVGFPPGGAVDGLARVLAPKLSEFLGQQVIVENRPGAAGNIATDFVAKAPADGHTILLTTIGHAIAPSLSRKPPFDAIADFVPVSQLIASSMMIVAIPKLPVSSLKDVIALAKSKPGGLNYGSAGAGDPLGLAMEMFKLAAGLDIVPIQYKGVGPTYVALLAGEVDLAVMPTSTSLAYFKAGTLRPIAVAGLKRSPALPDVPTIAESGFPGFDATNWQGLFVPAKTPVDIARRIQREAAKAVALPEIRDRMIAGGQEPVASTPEEFEVKLKSDVAKFARIIKDAKIPLQD